MKIIELCAFFYSVSCWSDAQRRATINGRPCGKRRGLPSWCGDTVNIVVYGEPEMTMKFIVDKSGTINFPYIGTLALKKTPDGDCGINATLA